MRRSLSVVAFVAASFLLGVSPARAQGYVVPALGIAFGNPSAQGRANFVVDAGGVPRNSPLGAEVDVTYAPNFFGSQGPFGQNSVTTVLFNVVVASGSERYGFFGRGRSNVRLYFSGGAGIMHEVVTTPAPVQSISNNDFGLNVGAGLMAFSSRTLGFRADLRYVRDLVNNQQGNTTTVDFGSFHFWRASFGAILAF